MEEIKLTDSVSIYKYKIEYDKENIIKELKFNGEFNDLSTHNELEGTVHNLKHFKREYMESPGLQSVVVINSKNIQSVKTEITNLIKKKLYNDMDIDFYQENWSYINDKNGKSTFYHDHKKNLVSKNIINEWTYTFYIQMPNNLKNNDGKLFFKIEDKEYDILPEEGDAIIFPASLLHKPELSPDSTIERIVFAGNIVKIDVNNHIKKREISLI